MTWEPMRRLDMPSATIIVVVGGESRPPSSMSCEPRDRLWRLPSSMSSRGPKPRQRLRARDLEQQCSAPCRIARSLVAGVRVVVAPFHGRSRGRRDMGEYVALRRDGGENEAYRHAVGNHVTHHGEASGGSHYPCHPAARGPARGRGRGILSRHCPLHVASPDPSSLSSVWVADRFFHRSSG